jgi:hypothetical protein
MIEKKKTGQHAAADGQLPLAYRNTDFMDTPQARPLRILSEYLQPLTRFR